MPYRLNPRDRTQVQVKRGAKWGLKKKFRTVGEARKYLAALSMNVSRVHRKT